jgi:CubicO group peptidase (beta-lactamase class C family)
MHNTTAWRSRVPASALAEPYEMGPDGFERIRLAKEDANMGPAGGHFSTAGDLARLLVAELNAGRVDGRPAIPAAVIAQTQQTQVPQDRQFAFYHRTGWALGWDVGTYETDTLLHRFGGFAGYYSHVSFMPGKKVGVVVLVNGGGAASALAEVVATAVYDQLLARPDAASRFDTRLVQLRERLMQARAAAAKDRATRAGRNQALPHPIENYAGTYENEQYGRLELRLAGERLEAVMGVARSTVEVYDASANRLRVELTGSGSVIQVEFPPQGGPASAVVAFDARFERK